MVTAIRIEHKKDGHGLYRPAVKRKTIQGHKRLIRLRERMSTYNPNGLPTPEDECLNLEKGGKQWFCAFNSMEDMREYIRPGELKYIARVGYRIYELKLLDCQKGKKQLIYTKDEVIKKKDITYLFK